MGHRSLIYDLSLEALIAQMLAWGEPAYRARQAWHALYAHLATSPEAMTDLPTYLRHRLAETFEFSALRPSVRSQSDDGTQKASFALRGEGQVEAVLMHDDQRYTACISTQVGCAVGCVFCATGQMGFQRNLTAGEIIEQALFFARELSRQGKRITNIVVMGMGEPFHNYEHTMEAIDRLNDPRGFNFGARRFTISTVGLVPIIERFTEEHRQINLAVSLHAATDELRDQLVPINKRYPLSVLFPACRAYVKETGRRITFEWALIEGVNDDQEQARLLAEQVQDMTCHVNLIPLNPTQGYEGSAASEARARAFRRTLISHRVPCTFRVRRGIDIQAGCGQLAAEAQTKKLP